MKRVRILCEGPTEEQFVNRILIPFFQPQEIYATPVVLMTKRYPGGGKERGGVSTYVKIAEQLRILCRDGEAYITTMLDYFMLPTNTPCMDLRRADTCQHVSEIEAAINNDIGSANCHANLMVHEFEALLFSEPTAFEGIMDAEAVQKIAEDSRFF